MPTLPTKFGPWTPHINAVDRGYEILLVRINTDQPGNRERWRDPYPCFTEWGAVRRARRLANARNRMQARIDARQLKIDARLAAGPTDLLEPYIIDNKAREQRP